MILIAVAIGILHTPWAKAKLEGLLEEQLSSETQQARIEGIGGFIPLGLELRSFVLADEQGDWLEVENAKFDVSISNLFRGAFRLQAVGAERVALWRLPPSSEPVEPPSDEPFAFPKAPELPETLPDLAIRNLFVDHLIIGEPIVGRQLDLAIGGEVRTIEDGREVTVDLKIDGIEQTKLNGLLAAALKLPQSALDLDLEINETGGLVAHLASMPEIGNVGLSWNGQGPLAGWRSDLTLMAEGVVNAAIGLDVNLSETPGLSINGNIEPAGELLPKEIADLLTRPVTLALDLSQQAPGQFTLTKIGVDSDPVVVDGSAQIDQVSGDLDADISLNASDLSRFSNLVGVDLEGAIDIRLQGANAEPGPLLTLDLGADGIAADQNAIQRVGGQFEFALSQPINEGFAGTSAIGQIDVDGIALNGEPLLQDQGITLALDADLQLQGLTTLNELSLDAGPATLNASGEVVIEEGTGAFQAIASVSALQELLQALNVEMPELSGASELKADINLAEQFQIIQANIDFVTNGLNGLPGGAVAVTGNTPSVSLKADVDLRDTAKITDIKLETAAATLSGWLNAGMTGDQPIEGRIDADIPALAALEPLLQQAIAGSAKLHLDLAGTAQAPAIELGAQVLKLAIAGQAIDAIDLKARSDELVNAPQGDLALDVRQPQGTLSLKTGYKLEGNDLTLSGISLKGPGTEISGDLSADLAGPLATGALKGGINDLAALQPWHGQNLNGSVDLDIQMNAEGGAQNLQANLALPNLSGDFGDLSELDLSATVSDAIQSPTIQAGLSFGLFEQPDLSVRNTAIDLSGTLNDLAITLQTAGEQANEPFEMRAGVKADLESAAKTIVLERLEGRAAGQDIRLQRPSTIVQDGELLNVDRLDLKIGEAQIEGGLNMGNGQIDGGLELKTLPLAMLNAFGAPDIQGQATGKATLKGSLANPKIEVSLDADAIRPSDPAFKTEHGLDFDLAAEIASGKAQAKVEIGNLSDDAAVINIALPLKLALEPFSFEMSDRAPLDGSVNGVIDLERITRVLQLDGQVIRGLLTAGLEIGGTIDKPQVLGETVLKDGLVEDSTSGLSLKFMRGKLVAETDEMRLEGFEARDGDGGRINIGGKIDIRPGGDFPFAFDVTSDDMRVLSNELGRIYIDTDVNIEGNAVEGAVGGTVTLVRAEIAIPSGGGIDPVALDVKQVGDAKPKQTEEPIEPEDSGPGYEMALDLVIDIPSEMFVRGRGLDTEWGGKLEISGKSSAPVVTGGIGYRRGFLDFLDRRFDIAQGEISFTGASPPIPEIDLRAEAQGPTLLAVVTITGPATAPELELSSEPNRPNDEILSDLLFNRDVSAITPVQALKLANAVRTLEGGGVDTMGQLRNAIGVDTLDIGGDSPEEASAKVGKYVADGVFLELEQGLASGKSTARVEVELTDSISLNTEVDNESQAGVGLEWSLDY